MHHHIGIKRFHLDDVGVDRWRRDLVAFLDHDHRRCLGAQRLTERLLIVLAEVVVLINHGDLGVRLFLQQIFGIDLRLDGVARLPAHGPAEVLRIIPLAGAGGDEQLRHLLCVHVFLERGVRGRAQRIEDQQDLVTLHQFAHLFHGLRRRICIVIGDEVDLATVHAAIVVDHLEIGGLGLAD